MKSSAIWALVLTACAAGGDPGSGEPAKPSSADPGPSMGPGPTNDGGTTGDPDAASGPDSGWISGGGTGFYSPMQMFNFINSTRQQYSNHIPYDGYPFEGMNASAMTWSTTLAWDAALAKAAQDEADRLAKGGMPTGTYFPFMNDGNGEGFYISGLDTPAYMLATRADAALPEFVNAYGSMEPPHHAYSVANGFFRMAVAYQTGTGSYAKKTKLGVGATEGGTNVTWWVLIFG